MVAHIGKLNTNNVVATLPLSYIVLPCLSCRNQSHFSPDSAPVSPPTPVPPPAPGPHHHRPASLPKGSSTSSGKSSSSSGGKRTRWLLCYHMGGGPPSASPSPPSEHAPHSQCSTPSPTDHGFKLPNSFSNERPTSLPVALLNCSAAGSAEASRCQQGEREPPALATHPLVPPLFHFLHLLPLVQCSTLGSTLYP